MEPLSPKKRNFLFIVAVIILTSLISFFLGRLSVLDTQEEKVQIYYPDVVKSIVDAEGGESARVSASKSGTKYYFEWCSSSVKEENKVYFDTKEKAENAGYTLASGCNEF